MITQFSIFLLFSFLLSSVSSILDIYWNRVTNLPTSSSYLAAPSISSQNGSHILLSNSSSLVISADAGKTFTMTQNPTQPFNPNEFSCQGYQLSAMSSDGHYMYAAVDGSSTGLNFIYISSDSGRSWSQPKSIPFMFLNVGWAGLITTSSGKTVLAIPQVGTLYISNDYGNSFTTINNITSSFWNAGAMSLDGSVIFVSSSQIITGGTINNVHMSRDGGSTWRTLDSPTENVWTGLACDGTGLHVVAGQQGGMLYYASESTSYQLKVTGGGSQTGGNWASVISSSQGQYFAATTNAGANPIYLSTDYGASFAPMPNSPSLSSPAAISASPDFQYWIATSANGSYIGRPSPFGSPSAVPSASPIVAPTRSPTLSPTASPVSLSTRSPTRAPSRAPTVAPSKGGNSTVPTTQSPTLSPTASRTMQPTPKGNNSIATYRPTYSPTLAPNANPTLVPVTPPSQYPTQRRPTQYPTNSPNSSMVVNVQVSIDFKGISWSVNSSNAEDVENTLAIKNAAEQTIAQILGVSTSYVSSSWSTSSQQLIVSNRKERRLHTLRTLDAASTVLLVHVSAPQSVLPQGAAACQDKIVQASSGSSTAFTTDFYGFLSSQIHTSAVNSVQVISVQPAGQFTPTFAPTNAPGDGGNDPFTRDISVNHKMEEVIGGVIGGGIVLSCIFSLAVYLFGRKKSQQNATVGRWDAHQRNKVAALPQSHNPMNQQFANPVESIHGL